MNTQDNTPADDVREALARTLWVAAVGDNPEGVPGESWEELLAEEPVWAQGYYFQADAAMDAFDVRPRGTVTDTQRLEYTIAAVSDNGAITQLADYTTVVRDHLKADLELYHIEQKRAKCDPDRIIIAQRPIPEWVRS